MTDDTTPTVGTKRTPSLPVLARYKRSLGMPLSAEERVAVRNYESRYTANKLSLYVTLPQREAWNSLAKARGQALSEWARDRIAEALAQQAHIAQLTNLNQNAAVDLEVARRDVLRHLQQVEQLKSTIDQKDREYAFLLRRTEVVRQ